MTFSVFIARLCNKGPDGRYHLHNVRHMSQIDENDISAEEILHKGQHLGLVDATAIVFNEDRHEYTEQEQKSK